MIERIKNLFLRHRLRIPFNDDIAIYLFCAVFLISFRFQALFYPPYWDSLVGPFTEALWLADHKFNYIQFALQEPNYYHGGARSYFFSIYPAFQALLIIAIKNHKLFLFINHLISVALSSGIVMLSYKTMKMVLEKKLAVLGSALMFLNPLYLSQSYAINMEIPTLFFGTLAVYYFAGGKGLLAGIFSLLSFYTKASGVAFSLAFSVVFLCSEFEFKKNKRMLLFFLLPLILYIVQNFAASRFFHEYLADASFTLAPFYIILFRFAVRNTDLYLIFLTIAVSVIGCLIAGWLRSVENFKTFAVKNKLILTCITLSLLQYFFTMTVSGYLSRYFLICFPFLFLSLTWFLQYFKRRWILISFAAVLFGYYALTLFGPLRFSKNALTYTNGDRLEKNLEYENNMETNLEAMKFLEANYQNNIIVTSWPITHMLASPEFGYVKKPFKVASTERPFLTWKPNVRSLKDVNVNDPAVRNNMIWVWTPNYFNNLNQPNKAYDILIHAIRKKRSLIYIFKRTDKFFELQKNNPAGQNNNPPALPPLDRASKQ